MALRYNLNNWACAVCGRDAATIVQNTAVCFEDAKKMLEENI